MNSDARWRARIVLLSLAVLIGVLSSGCFLRLASLVVTSVPGGYPDYEDSIFIRAGFQVEASVCHNSSNIPEFVGCAYTITTAGGSLIGITSTFDLVTAYGFFGLLIDPLVLQVPADAGGFSGTVDTGDGVFPLVVTQTQQFKAGPKKVVAAEPGMQFVIVELPQSVIDIIGASDPDEGVSLDLVLEFSPAALPMQMKSMFTVRVDEPEGTYYLPMAPCTTNFATIPAMTISSASVFTAEDDINAMAETYASLACDGEVYDLRTIPAPGDPGVTSLFVPGITFN
jgi:hypothetical protein